MTQPQLLQAMTQLFPQEIFLRDFTVVVDGNGNASITSWNAALGTQPSADQLTAALTANRLSAAQTAQTAIITTGSSAAQANFVSSALGSAYTYPSASQDQANLTACITASLLPGNPSGWTCLFWCTSAAGASSFAAHTAAEIQQVGRDALAAIMTAKARQLTLIQQIEAATTVAAVQAVVW